ncbi:helix-turn-helix transcriptional regulator [Pelomonas aquatica]|jgi:predicted DNA-binding transcriptional regulator AlpA|uniref:AlpA family phage regulatory protein n=1 Tax=Pelomonas aquatica TaxID=431058 RepID=A0A9X4LMN7_9BURK|nr:AlpA family phage regulatory protein [Pelomonas aquatica]MDG0863740.1 AlpA family phage regulatory protein [Pelomonas aquatica]
MDITSPAGSYQPRLTDPSLPITAQLEELRRLKIDVVCSLVQLSRQQIYKLIARGAFPSPVRGQGPGANSSRWVARDVRDWLLGEWQPDSVRGAR